MNVLLLYFSGTGITRYYSSLIEEEFKKRGHNCQTLDIEELTDLPLLWQRRPVALSYTIRAESRRPLSKFPWPYYDLPMALKYAREIPEFNILKSDWSRYDLIGFGSPVYAFRPAPVMIRFMLDLPRFEKEIPVFSFATHDGAQGDFEAFMKLSLAKKGLNHIGHLDQSFIYSAAAVMRSKMNHVKSGKLLIKKSEAARNKIAHFIERIESDPVGRVVPFRARDILSKIIGIPYRFFYSYGIDFMLNYTLFGFGINKEDCVQCMTCVRQCPQGLIELDKDDYPIRYYHCMYCLRCLNWCPTNALYFSPTTQGKARFPGPEILLEAAERYDEKHKRKKNSNSQ